MYQDSLTTDPDNIEEDICVVCGKPLKKDEYITWVPSGFGWPDWGHEECLSQRNSQ